MSMEARCLCYYTCVRILLYVCPHAAVYVSACCYMCARIQLLLEAYEYMAREAYEYTAREALVLLTLRLCMCYMYVLKRCC